MRSRLEPELRQKNLIQAGLKIFSKRSLHSLSASEVAQECDISKGLLFHYFTSLNNFYVEVLRAASEELILLTLRSEHLRGQERLVRVISDYLDWVEDHPEIYRMLLNSDLGTHPVVRKIHERKRKHYQSVVLDALFSGESHDLKRVYDFIGASAYVEAMVLHWLSARDLSRSKFQVNLLDGIARIILAQNKKTGGTL